MMPMRLARCIHDSGYNQSLDFFDDGTRIPLIKHSCTDRASILKFVDKNWSLAPISKRSRDNFAQPATRQCQLVPNNRPAIGDLMDVSSFPPSWQKRLQAAHAKSGRLHCFSLRGDPGVTVKNREAKPLQNSATQQPR
jgi:hypothetical protein